MASAEGHAAACGTTSTAASSTAASSTAAPPTAASPTGAAPVAACKWTPQQTAEIRNLVHLNQVLAQILECMAAAGYSEHDQFGARLSLEEAVVNGLKHGNREDPSKAVRVSFCVTHAAFHVAVEDEGPGFNPDNVPDPLAPENIERPGGRGVFLMRHYMTSVHFNDRGNCVTLCKVRSEQRPTEPDA